MKAIVVYYSLEGNTKYIADSIAEMLDADILNLEPIKAYRTGSVSKFFWGGKSVVLGEKPKLVPYDFKVENYDVVILGTPVWAGSFAPPLKTFIKENVFKGKEIALFACSSGGNAEKCFVKLKQELQIENVIATVGLIDPLINKSDGNNINKIREFIDNLLRNTAS